MAIWSPAYTPTIPLVDVLSVLPVQRIILEISQVGIQEVYRASSAGSRVGTNVIRQRAIRVHFSSQLDAHKHPMLKGPCRELPMHLVLQVMTLNS